MTSRGPEWNDDPARHVHAPCHTRNAVTGFRVVIALSYTGFTMRVTLRFPGFPGVLLPFTKDETADFRDESVLGDALDEAVRRLHAWGRLPGLSGSVRGVDIAGVPVSSHAHISGVFLQQPGNLWMSPPGMHLVINVHCDWEAPSKKGLFPARQTPLFKALKMPIPGPVRVSRSTFTDILQLRDPSKVMPSRPFFQDVALEVRELRRLRNKCRVYFSSACVEGFETGDTDYIKSLVRALRAMGVEATRIVQATEEAQTVWKSLDDPGELTLLDYQPVRGEKELSFDHAVDATLEYILQQKALAPKAVHILHVQSRWPASGNAFKGRLKRFADNGIKIVTTVHEYRYNERTPLDWVNNSVVLDEYCLPADRVVFLNIEDLRKAVRDSERQGVFMPKKFVAEWRREQLKAREREKKTLEVKEEEDRLEEPEPVEELVRPGRVVRRQGLQEKAHHIPVARTVDTTNLSERASGLPVRILLFGMIRSGKGDKSAITLAERIVEAKLDWRVVIAGSASDHKTLAAVLGCAFTKVIVEQVFGEEKDYTKLKDLKERVAECMRLREELRGEYEVDLRDFVLRRKPEAERQQEEFLLQNEEELKRLREENALLRRTSKKAVNPNKKRLDTLNREASTLERALRPPDWHCLPIDVFVNLSTPELSEVFNDCKYAYKEDEKGMADNASSIVSCVANGCITFTSLGKLTPLDFIQAPQGERISFTKLSQDALWQTVFDLDESEVSLMGGDTPRQPLQALVHYRAKYHGAVVTPPRGEDATPEFVFQQISLREESPHLNLESYEAMKRAIETRFEPGRIATQHCLVYLDLLS